MMRALWRYLLARHRLRAHQRAYGDLSGVKLQCMVPDCPAPLIASHVPIADAMAADRAHQLLHHPAQPLRPGECRQPLGTVPGVWCTEPRGHGGQHRHLVATVELDLGETTWREGEDGWVATVVRPQQLRWRGRG